MINRFELSYNIRPTNTIQKQLQATIVTWSDTTRLFSPRVVKTHCTPLSFREVSTAIVFTRYLLIVTMLLRRHKNTTTGNKSSDIYRYIYLIYKRCFSSTVTRILVFAVKSKHSSIDYVDCTAIGYNLKQFLWSMDVCNF